MLLVLRFDCLVFRVSSFVCHVTWDSSVFTRLVLRCLVSVQLSCMGVVWVVVRFSRCSLFGVCFWCFRFARRGASRRVGASALSLCCVLACVLFLLLPGLGKRVVICMFLERVVHIFLRFPFCSHVFLSGPTLRVAPAETRLTVYRRSNISSQSWFGSYLAPRRSGDFITCKLFLS